MTPAVATEETPLVALGSQHEHHIKSAAFATAQKFNWSQQFAALFRWNLTNKTREPARLIEAAYNFVIYMGLLVVLNRLVFAATGSVSVSQLPLLASLCPSSVPDCIPLAYVTPNTSFPSPINSVIDEIKSLMLQSERVTPDVLMPFNSLADMIAYQKVNRNKLNIGVEFVHFNASTFDLEYSIWVPDNTYYSDGFIDTGYASAQAYIERAVINVQRASKLPSATKLKSPLLYSTDGSNGIQIAKMATKSGGLLITLALYLLFTFHSVTISLFLRSLSAESTVLKPGMLVMGLDENAYLAAMTAAQMCFSIPAAILATIVVCTVAKVFVYTSPILVLISFVLYTLTLNGQAFFIACCVPNLTIAASTSFGLLGIFASMAVALLGLLSVFPTASRAASLAYMLVPQAAMTQFLRATNALENSNTNVSFGTLGQQGDVQGAMVMLVVDVVVWIAAGLAITRMRSLLRRRLRDPLVGVAGDASAAFNPEDVQSVDFSGIPEDARNVVQVLDVKKTYLKKASDEKAIDKADKHVRALRGVSIDLHRGQTLALLGHNGAGKTTLLSILYGHENASSGKVLVKVKGSDGNSAVLDAAVERDLVQIRQHLGVCPQFDVLFATFTPREHLRLYAGLKGITVQYIGDYAANGTSHDALSAYIDALLSDVGLDDKADSRAGTLSGGQKRKLSLAIALLGSPSLILLDEPTTGMDASAVEQVWRLLQHVKRGRTIVLTTHSMEEADTLGDRIAVLSHGQFQALGTSMFLKGRFGVGYQLTVDFRTSNAGNVDELLRVVQRSFEGAVLEDDHQGEDSGSVTMVLVKPTGASQVEYSERLSGLFGALQLEHNQGRLNDVQSFGLSQTTLEQVFLKLKEADKNE
ncbi:hypothetical protein BC830DRAFT_1083718 [Chytriomyces sp. MP71]|nr:hypothetical protein BC830DRAFT_1083718 [Chytriomyces sp. MP71]